MKNTKKPAALLLAVLMITSLCACSRSPDNSADVATLRQEVEALQQQVEDLQQRLDALEAGAIADWSLTGTPLVQGSGASVTLSVTPSRYQEGQLATFRVLLEGQVAAELFCDWDGTSYTASVELDAADGYSYYVILTEANGKQEYLELNSPEKLVDANLVYMYSSLSASCMLNIYEWAIGDDALTISAGSVEVRLPQLTVSGEPARCTSASLILQLNGEEVERSSLTLPEAGGEGIAMNITDVRFAAPALDEGSQLDLWLEVVLSDGQVLTHSGSSWYCSEGELIQAVG